MGSYYDARLIFAEQHDLGADGAIGDHQIGDLFNTQGAEDAGPGQRLEAGTKIPIFCMVDGEACVGVGATVEFIVQGSSAVAFGSPVDVCSSGQIPVTALATIGDRVKNLFVGTSGVGLQYFRLIARVATANITAGFITAWVEAGQDESGVG